MFRSDQLPSEMVAKMTHNIAQVQDYKTKQVSYNKVCSFFGHLELYYTSLYYIFDAVIYSLPIQVHAGVIIANGETVLSPAVLQSLGVTAVLNAAEEDVPASPTKLAALGIQYHGFHVPDLPGSDISRSVLCRESLS